MLNHAGVCVSYTTAWKYLKKLSIESRFLEIVRDGHWIWAYDNLNFNIRVRHERDGNQQHVHVRSYLLIIHTSRASFHDD